jgi:hypothetical protein
LVVRTIEPMEDEWALMKGDEKARKLVDQKVDLQAAV